MVPGMRWDGMAFRVAVVCVVLLAGFMARMTWEQTA
jgi:hypothetical protein